MKAGACRLHAQLFRRNGFTGHFVPAGVRFYDAADNFAIQWLPRRVSRRTPTASRRAISRNPSCFLS
jgi:hypothetical protein